MLFVYKLSQLFIKRRSPYRRSPYNGTYAGPYGGGDGAQEGGISSRLSYYYHLLSISNKLYYLRSNCL